MPEINEPPKSALIVSKANVGNYLEKITYPDQGPDMLSHPQIKQRISRSKEQIKATTPGISGEQIDLMSHLIYGPWNLDEPFKIRKEDEAQREEAARMQQHLAHSIYYAGTEEAPQKYTDKIYDLMTTYEKLAQLPGGKDFGVPNFVNAVKSQLALMKTLADNGCTIYLPDYSRHSDQHEKSEVWEWDLKFETDFIAVTADGRIMLIDAKGQMFEKDDQGEQTDQIRDHVSMTKSLALTGKEPIPDHLRTLRRKIKKIKAERNIPNKPLIFATLVLPTSPAEMSTLGGPENSNDKKEGIRKFGQLEQKHQDAIISLLTGAISNARQI